MRYPSQKIREYGNPLFAKGVRKAWITRHPRLTLTFLCILTAGSAYCLYGLPYWQLQKLTVTGTYTLSLNELQQLTLRQKSALWLVFFQQDKLWSFDTAAYERRLRERWIFSELKIQRRLPGTIALTVTEEKPAFTFSNGEQVYGVDRNGLLSTLVTEKLPERTPALTFASSPADVAIGTTILQKENVTFIEQWSAALQARNIPTLVVTSIQIATAPDQTVRLRVAGEWEIIVDQAQPAQPQIDAFFAAYDQKLQGRTFQYVDVTVPARVYYK